MARSLSLSHLSALDQPPAQLVALAAEAGYGAVGLRLHPAAPGAIRYSLVKGSSELAETLHRMEDTGVVVHDVEFIPLTPALDIPACAFMFETAATLGARRVNVSGDDADQVRLTARFAEICELAGAFGLAVDLEFMRWREIGSLAQAAEVVRRAGAPNGAILLDALHLFRSGGNAAEVRALDPGLIRCAQLCDAPAEAPSADRIIEEARNHRLPPGQGGLPLPDLVRSLPRDIVWSVEVPMPAASGLTPLEHARTIREAADALLDAALPAT